MTAVQIPDPDVVAQLERLARTELSLRSRLGHVLLALVASAMTIVIVSLWLTEPALPARTTVAFGMLTIVGLGWIVYGTWVLSARRVMLARQRVVAGRLAMVFSSAFTAGCLWLALVSHVSPAWPAAAMGLGMVAVALVLWRRAESAHAHLVSRRQALERDLVRSGR